MKSSGGTSDDTSTKGYSGDMPPFLSLLFASVMMSSRIMMDLTASENMSVTTTRS